MIPVNNTIRIINCHIITPFRTIKNGTISVRNGIIEDIEGHLADLPGARIIDAGGMYVAPGLIDLQINGYNGIDFSDQNLTSEAMFTATKALRKTGVTTFFPTVITNDGKNLLRSFSLLSEAVSDLAAGISVPGFHLEGPYISPEKGFRGAHPGEHIRKPDWDEFSRLQEAAKNRIRLVTLAPETDGAMDFIKKCTGSGVVVSLGHHNASSIIIQKAVDAGASMSTHLGNGCAEMINRFQNPFWPQLANDRITITIIADGSHLTEDQVKCFCKIKGPDRLVLVSDALDLAGLPPGEYERDGRILLVTPDVVRYPAENVMAGAVKPVSENLMNLIKFTGCSLNEAVRMASTNAAVSMGLTGIGEIKHGNRADLIMFNIENGKIDINKTFIAGNEVYSSG